MNNRIDENNYINCTGCRMCGDLCPTNAISFGDDQEGFPYPVIDEDKCIHCGKCHLKCPILQDVKLNSAFEPVVYSAASKNSELRGRSTSGGVFGELANWILAQNGVVCGCIYGEDYKSAKHILVDTSEKLEKLIGTKYFQSDTTGVYKEIENFLKINRTVLFAGTPCQNAALKAYLGKDYDNLFQMDFICNSISSPLAYRKWLENLEQIYSSKIVKVRFKDKKEGWIKLNTEVTFENGSVHREDRASSLWGKGLIQYNLYQRKSCYDCKFRKLPNYVADITVGDFWGLQGVDSYDLAKGISLVIINSSKGEYLFKSIKKNMICNKRTLDDVRTGNPRAEVNPVYHKERDRFFESLKENSFVDSMKICTGEVFKKEKKEHITISEIKDVLADGRISLFKYIRLNYLSPNIIRTGSAKIIPFKNAILNIDSTARIILHGDQDFYIGKNALKNSKTETLVRLEEGAKVELFHGGELIYGSTLEVKKYATFSAGWFGFNTGCVLVCQRKITFGEEVMCGRNVVFYDSDFHKLSTMSGKPINPPKDILIKDHVWITGDARILPGSIIGSNTLIRSFSCISSEIPDWSCVSSDGLCKVTKLGGLWSRGSNCQINLKVNSKANYKQILVGFGNEGKQYYTSQSDYIYFIIDNFSKDERAIKWDDFVEKKISIEDNYIFVIGSSKFYDELYAMVINKYPKAKVVSYDSIMWNLMEHDTV